MAGKAGSIATEIYQWLPQQRFQWWLSLWATRASLFDFERFDFRYREDEAFLICPTLNRCVYSHLSMLKFAVERSQKITLQPFLSRTVRLLGDGSSWSTDMFLWLFSYVHWYATSDGDEYVEGDVHPWTNGKNQWLVMDLWVRHRAVVKRLIIVYRRSKPRWFHKTNHGNQHSWNMTPAELFPKLGVSAKDLQWWCQSRVWRVCWLYSYCWLCICYGWLFLHGWFLLWLVMIMSLLLVWLVTSYHGIWWYITVYACICTKRCFALHDRRPQSPQWPL